MEDSGRCGTDGDRGATGAADVASARPAVPRTWPRDFLDALAADPRIAGAAELQAAPGGAPQGIEQIRIATTWDGLDGIAADLPRLGALAVGSDSPNRGATDGSTSVTRHAGTHWSALLADGRRVEIEAMRIGELKPSADGEGARSLVDPKGHIEQWARWSRNRPIPATPRDAPGTAARRTQAIFDMDSLLRAARAIPPGARRILRGDRSEPLPARFAARARLARLRPNLAPSNPAEATLAATIDAFLASVPGAGEGLRATGDCADPAAAFDAFLCVADAEGFLGDRVLFGAAETQLQALARRAPVFDEGFVVPTFDAVEARWRFGEGIGGCKIPLIPAVHVGIGVTPEDHLEFWAAPAVREPGCTVAAVADSGTRTVVPRTAGKRALLAALHDAVEGAWDRLPSLIRAARRAGRVSEGDVAAAWTPLHLPKSFVAGANAVLGTGSSRSRLTLALCLARSGDDAPPLVARKLGLAAGRLLSTTP